MKHFYLSVHTHSPLAIRADHAEGGAKTTQYIAGTALLGSLAATHRLLRPEAKDEFEAIFLQQRVLFPHLYPARFGKAPNSGIAGSNLPVRPLPKTAQTCKRFPGFRPLDDEDTDEERHGIRDSLLDWTTFALLDSPGQTPETLLEPFRAHKNCQQCPHKMDHERGYYRCSRNNQLRMKAESHTRLQTYTGVNREWGTVEENILYNRQVFEQGMQFWGEIILPDELAQTLASFIQETDDEDIMYMGTGKTRGMGKVLLKRHDAESEITLENHAAFQERLLKFDRALKERATKAKPSAPFYLAVTLHSDSILCDPFLRYYSTLDGTLFNTLLRPYLPQDYPAITWHSIYQTTATHPVHGWNDLWGTPRMIDHALEMGSTFVFACSQALDNTLVQALYALEEEGIGRRRAEGFGRIRLADPFHLEGEQV